MHSAQSFAKAVKGEQLQEHIDISELAQLIKNAQANGAVLEIEDHKRIVVS